MGQVYVGRPFPAEPGTLWVTPSGEIWRLMGYTRTPGGEVDTSKPSYSRMDVWGRVRPRGVLPKDAKKVWTPEVLL